jgi:peptidoglycan/xylan/chitin deacetylase (PgdA/CDA1 family)
MLAGYVYAWAPLRNRVRARRGRCHATVLLYHRVSDSMLDSLTVGVEQFQRQLDVLRRHYDVVDLPALLARRGQPRSRPCVVITFDDGYADNLLAARLLRRAGLPATFFLSTGIVGSDAAFPHDLQSLGRRVEPLTWPQARQMAGWGFDFGNHTEQHTRLSAVELDAALREIQAAEQRLDAELHRNGQVRCLAWPYGGAGDCTDALRRSLGRLGITACLSAYGGVNPHDFDPLNILRQGIDHSFDTLAFRAAVEGRRCRA